jgi:hypothetical protein
MWGSKLYVGHVSKDYAGIIDLKNMHAKVLLGFRLEICLFKVNVTTLL